MEKKPQVMIVDETSEKIIATAERLAMTEGADQMNVRKILNAMGISNRVFYNRFQNVEEVLLIVYDRVVARLHQSITEGFDENGDFFEQVITVVTNTLVMSYDVKQNLGQYVFEMDSLSSRNYEWWKNVIKRLITLGKERGYLKDVDLEVMSHAIWCFIRGYNADALGRKIPKEDAVKDFKYAFSVLLEGMKA